MPTGGAAKVALAAPVVTATVRTGGMTTPFRSRRVKTTWEIGPVTVAVAAMEEPAMTTAAKGTSTMARTTAEAAWAMEKPCATARSVFSGPTAPSSVTPVPSAGPTRMGSSAMASADCRIIRSPGFRLPATGAK